MSQSISPRKVTGNFGEPAVCKNAALKAFSLNISFIPKPARPDLDLVSPIEEITPAQIRAIPTIPQSIPTQAEVLARADATAQDLSNLTSQTQLAQAIVSQQDSLRLITQSLDPEIDAITSFSEEMSLRLAAFQQNFVSLKDQLSTVRSNLLSVSQKPACSALD
jgi:hypothetical protein